MPLNIEYQIKAERGPKNEIIIVIDIIGGPDIFLSEGYIEKLKKDLKAEERRQWLLSLKQK